MSDTAVPITAAPPHPREHTRAFVAHAKLIGFFTLISRFLGLAREIVAGHYLGTGIVASAFTVAFTIPNLFRKLFGEGALSAAFIPLYAQALKAEINRDGSYLISTNSGGANDFAAAAVNLLCAILLAITIVGEIALCSAIYFGAHLWPDLML